MQKSLLLFITFIIFINAIGQNVGIGINNPNTSSKLDISSSDKGLLIPRIALVQTTSNAPITSPATSLLVYNTANVNDVSPGFYYWNGIKWLRFVNEPSTDWTLLGSTGTVSGTNFLGTKDSQDLDIRTNNFIRIRVTTKGQIEVFNTGSSVFVGESAGDNDDLSANENVFVGYQSGLANSTGARNTASGAFSLSSNTLGYDNTALGHYALFTNTIGDSNVAIGQGALFTNISGNNNTAIGLGALNRNTASNNIAIGRLSLGSNTTGTQNIAIGNNALFANTTSDNVAIGHNALGLNTNGNFNLGIGTNALSSNVSGAANLAIGLNALNSNTASNNFAIGFRALDINTLGTFNLAIGQDALGGNTIGSNNLAIGYNSLLLNTASNNVGIGYTSGNTNTTGSNNTLIGANSDVSATNLTNATAIGANSVVNTSNSLVLGNGVNVGIGTSSPIYAKLQVVGFSVFSSTTGAFSASTHAPYIRGNDGFSTETTPSYTWYNSDQTGIFHPATGVIGFSTNGTGEVMRISTNRVGIGTTTPGGLFELSLDQARKPGTATWTIVSDERLKNIEGNYTKGMKELLQLRAISYHYKNVGNRIFKEEVLNTNNVGFSAQNVQTVFPEAVGTDEDGYLNLNIHPILIAYLNAIKELNSNIEKLQAENNAIKSELDSMKQIQKDLDELKSQIQLLKSKP